MNWKSMAAERLRRYPFMQQSLKSTAQEYKMLELDATRISSATSSGFGSNSFAGRENHLLDSLAYRQELECSMKQTTYWLRATESALEMLSPQSLSILKTTYMDAPNAKVADICQVLGLDRASYYRKLDSALREFTLGLYGALES